MVYYGKLDNAFFIWREARRDALYCNGDKDVAWSKENSAWGYLMGARAEVRQEEDQELCDLIDRVENERQNKQRESWDETLEQKVKEYEKRAVRPRREENKPKKPGQPDQRTGPTTGRRQ